MTLTPAGFRSLSASSFRLTPLVARQRQIFNTVVIWVFLLCSPGIGFSQDPEIPWKANGSLKDPKPVTVKNLGACQGVALINNRIYLYGDRYDLKPRQGVVQEFTLNMAATGRVLKLNVKQQPLMTHPTGFAYFDRNNVFIGDTVNQKAKIYLIDWELAWRDGNLDRAVKNVVNDDIAVNGCRPLTIEWNRRRWVASADYGGSGNRIRIYDADRLATAKTTSESGVLLASFPSGKFNQNLAFDPVTGTIICVQNVVPGVGWRLDYLKIAPRQELGDSKPTTWSKLDLVRTGTVTLPAHTELEGFQRLPNGKSIFVTAHRENNVWIGELITIAFRKTKAGHKVPFFQD